ncbi:hypothetical protein [Paenibacillus dendritiformis]|uniref:hypothetical protein n=1 Tax=Paenibacillus dendritiformis TaxID=130049 RepID=UPI001BCC4DA6|nr:hypothetical protein [Paenibacillus dendritiformis]
MTVQPPDSPVLHSPGFWAQAHRPCKREEQFAAPLLSGIPAAQHGLAGYPFAAPKHGRLAYEQAADRMKDRVIRR